METERTDRLEIERATNSGWPGVMRPPARGSKRRFTVEIVAFVEKNRTAGTYRLVHCAIKLSAKGSLVTHFIKSAPGYILASSKVCVNAGNFLQNQIL